MLKVTLIIDNIIASPDSPKEFVLREVLKSNPAFKLLDIRVEQESSFKKLSDK